MIVIFQSSNPYLAYTAAAIYYHVKPSLFFRKWNWRKNPLLVLGCSKGETICCMAYGKYGWLYSKVIKSVAALFKLIIIQIDISGKLPWSCIPLNMKWKISLVRVWPQIFEKIYRGEIYHFMQKYSIINRQGDAG